MEFINDLVNEDGSLNRTEFHFNGYHYTLTGTQSAGHHQPALEARDTLTRSDGKIIEITRRVMRDYFAGRIKNAVILKEDIKILRHAHTL